MNKVVMYVVAFALVAAVVVVSTHGVEAGYKTWGW